MGAWGRWLGLLLGVALLGSLPAGPAAALTVEQVLELRKAGVSNETIALLLENETRAKRQGGVGRYVVKNQAGREYIVYQASSPRGVVDYTLDNQGAPYSPPEMGVILGAQRPPEQPAPQAAVQPVSQLYTLHLASFPDEAQAKDFVARLRKMGLAPQLTPVDLGKNGVWQRVLVGGFPSRAQAESRGRELVKKGIISSFRILPD
ncbi:MAG: SPOR domain-containing protein [Deltaproteobacteria bacterium]|nr:SPOR domain-containing protein [Deltaproteobacteria bacterium]